MVGSRLASSFALRVAVLALVGVSLGQIINRSEGVRAQRTMPGADLSGVWDGREGGEEGASADSFGKETPPMQPWAEKKYKANRPPNAEPSDEGLARMDPTYNCFPPGPTWPLTQPLPIEIIQIPGRVLLRYEYDHWVRQIWMDGRKHPVDPDPTWMGHSIGRWDGDVLVVDTIGLNDKTWIDDRGLVHSDALHTVERYKRVDRDTLVVEVTFDDPKAFTKPWTGRRTFKLRPDWHIMEHVGCEDRLVVMDDGRPAIKGTY